MQHAQSGLPFAAETMFVLARAVVYATVFVVLYEEPALRRAFGDEYETYSRQVGRWGC